MEDDLFTWGESQHAERALEASPESVEVEGAAPSEPPTRHLPIEYEPDRVTRRERILGCVIGAAIGDALGHPTEFIGSFDEIRRQYPPNGVSGFEKWWEQDERRFAPYTDDTQMSEAVFRALLDESADLDACMVGMSRRFVAWAERPQGGHRAPGGACMSGCRALARGVPWWRAGGPTAGGCGSVMRAYPFGLFFADDLRKAEEWAVAHSKLTHRDPIALAASAAMAVGIGGVMKGKSLTWTFAEMLAATARYSAHTAFLAAKALDDALGGVPPEETLDRLRGWAAHEAIAAAVYLFARHPDDFAAAVLEGANTPGDSDSLATLVGALVGARLGISAIPPEWVEQVERSHELQAMGEGLARRVAD